MVIMKGDALTVYIRLTQGETVLTPELLEDVEVCIGGAALRKTYREGEVSFDMVKEKWCVRLTQEDTLSMKTENKPVIARVKFRNAPAFDVRGIKVGSITVQDTYSREVL